MCRGLACWVSIVLVGLTAAVVRADIQTGLIGYWPLDGDAVDASGSGFNGTITKVTPVPDRLGHASSAMSFTGAADSAIDVGDPVPLQITGPMTLAAWVRLNKTDTNNGRIIAKSAAAGARSWSLNIEATSGGVTFPPTFQIGISSGASNLTVGGPKPLPTDEWAHIAGVYRPGEALEVYVNGELQATSKTGIPASQHSKNSQTVLIGNRHGATNCGWDGLIDEARIYTRALSPSDVKELVSGRPGLATNPVPASGQTDVLADAVLSWTPGKFAAAHDIYLGTSLPDVTGASVAKPLGVLIRAGQDANTCDPGPLAFGKTYYWRVDEVNQAPDTTVYQGDVWSFTVEPYGYPIKPAQATASSAQPGMGPEKTIDGSGLTGDLHGIESSTMWLSTGAAPNWIQYEFDQVYKLYQLVVWNSNQQIESFLGFGARKVAVETSIDGTTWTALANVPEFSKAPGAAGYVANTTVNLGSVEAKYVRLTIQSPWGTAAQTGLSEVRFFYVPVQARVPRPAAGATNVGLSTTLNWRPGREAGSHKVFFGTDRAAVTDGTAPAQTSADHAFDPGPLTYGTTYYWKVDEVNTVTYPGAVWSFTTQEFAIVDDFESYDDDNNRIYDAWIDGLTNGNTGSTVGYFGAPFAERTIIHGGKQSMPLDYNNTKSPYYSEAERVWDTPQNWAANGADTLTVYFRGRPAGFVESAPGQVMMSGSGADIWNTADQFRFACKQLAGNGVIIAKVESVDNTDPWAKGGVMIRESLDPGARFAAVYATPGNGVRYQARLLNAAAATSDTTVATAEQMALKMPVWIKMERVGTSFNGYYSTDGVKWTAMSWNPQTIAMSSTVYIGLAVTSHNTAAATTAQFANVSTTGNVTGSWDVQAIGVAQPVNDAAPVYVTVQDSAGKSRTISHPNAAAATLATWQQWRIALSDLSAAGVKLTAVKKMVVGIGDRANPKPDGAGLLFIDDIGVGHPATTNP